MYDSESLITFLVHPAGLKWQRTLWVHVRVIGRLIDLYSGL